MNQILGNENIENKSDNYNNNIVHKNNVNKILLFSSKKNLLKLLCFIFSIASIFFIVYFFISNYDANQKEKLSHEISDNYSIISLYSNLSNPNYSFSNIEYSNEYDTIIGFIDIPNINIDYPIFSNTTEELLKISPCRFSGPLPGEIGNLCIAGHNYVDNKFFSNLYKLNIGDYIYVSDIYNNTNTYSVFKKYEVSTTDTSCTDQNTNGKIIITLITCNNVNGKRLVIQAENINE